MDLTQPDHRQYLVNSVVHFRLGPPFVLYEWVFYVFSDIKGIKESSTLEEHGDPSSHLHQFCFPHSGNILSKSKYLSLVGSDKADEHLYQYAFSRTGATNDTEGFPFVYFKIKAAVYDCGAKGLVYINELNEWLFSTHLGYP